MPKNLLTRIILSGVRYCSPMKINFDVSGGSGRKTVRELGRKRGIKFKKTYGLQWNMAERIADGTGLRGNKWTVFASLVFVDGLSDKVSTFDKFRRNLKEGRSKSARK